MPENANEWDTTYWSDQDWPDLWNAWDAEPESRTLVRDRDTRRGFFPSAFTPAGKGKKGKKRKKGKKGKGKRPVTCFRCGGPHRSSERSQQHLPALAGPPPMQMLKRGYKGKKASASVLASARASW